MSKYLFFDETAKIWFKNFFVNLWNLAWYNNIKITKITKGCLFYKKVMESKRLSIRFEIDDIDEFPIVRFEINDSEFYRKIDVKSFRILERKMKIKGILEWKN